MVITLPGIRVKEMEPFENALRRFKRMVEKSGILSEMRRRESYAKPSELRKRALAAAIRRQRKKSLRKKQDQEDRRRH